VPHATNTSSHLVLPQKVYVQVSYWFSSFVLIIHNKQQKQRKTNKTNKNNKQQQTDNNNATTKDKKKTESKVIKYN